jgi:hypothetical protein
MATPGTIEDGPTLIVELIFWGGDPGRNPTDARWRRGDPRASPPATIRFTKDGWSLSSDAPPVADLDVHVKRVLAKVSRLDLSKVATPATDVELSIAAYCEDGRSPVLWIAAEDMSELAGLRTHLSIDLYCG